MNRSTAAAMHTATIAWAWNDWAGRADPTKCAFPLAVLQRYPNLPKLLGPKFIAVPVEGLPRSDRLAALDAAVAVTDQTAYTAKDIIAARRWLEAQP